MKYTAAHTVKASRRRASKKPFAKVSKFFASLPSKILPGIGSLWERPLVACIILAIPAAVLLYIIATQAFIHYFNCEDLLGGGGRIAKLPGLCPFKIWFTAPSLQDVVNPPLEWLRRGITWSILFFFIVASLFISKIVDIFRSLVNLLKFDKDEWKRVLTSLKTTLLIFLAFSLLFYFTVMR